MLDLITSRGERGKWFAAAKDAGFLDVALNCAGDQPQSRRTLVRAARDFAGKEPKFAAEIALLALEHLLIGGGYNPQVSLVEEAFSHLMSAASRIGAEDWAGQRAQRLIDLPCSPDRSHMQLFWPSRWRVGAKRLGNDVSCPIKKERL